MIMTIKYSLNGPDATARQFRDLRRTQAESTAAIAGSINPMLQYLTGGDGVAGSAKSWSVNGTSATANNQSQPVPYDPSIDLTVSITVPRSGRAAINVQSWISLGLNAYTNDSNNPISVGCRAGILVLAWYEGNNVPDLSPGDYGGCQLYGTVWGSNNAHDFGTSVSRSVYYAELEPAARINFRTRRYYWGWARNSNGDYIALPSGSWYAATIEDPIIQVTPVYDNSKGE